MATFVMFDTKFFHDLTNIEIWSRRSIIEDPTKTTYYTLSCARPCKSISTWESDIIEDVNGIDAKRLGGKTIYHEFQTITVTRIQIKYVFRKFREAAAAGSTFQEILLRKKVYKL